MENPHREPIPIILLAAGESSRLGQPKQLLTIRGTTLLRHIAKICIESGVGPVVVVLGSQEDIMRQELEGLPLHILSNVDWSSGLASSIRCGVQYIMQLGGQPKAAIFVLCDQLLLTPKIIQQVRDRYVSFGADLISCQYGVAYGPPTLVGQVYFDELLTLTGQQGAKKLLAQYPERIDFIPFEGGEVDIDFPGDLENLKDL